MAQIIPLITSSNFELVLQRIFDILVTEEINQEAQAITSNLNPVDYSWLNTLESFLPIQAINDLTIPVVNIWLDGVNYVRANNKTTLINSVNYNIDVYGKSLTSTDGAIQGLSLASKLVHRVLRQVQAILMSPKYVTLGFPLRDIDNNPINFIESRRFNNIEKFQPSIAVKSTENVIAARMQFQVNMGENLYDLTGDSLDQIIFTTNVTTGE